MVTRGRRSARSGNTRKRMLSALSCHSNTRSHGAWLLRLGAQGRGALSVLRRALAASVPGPRALGGSAPQATEEAGCRLGVPALHKKLLRPEI